MKPIAKKKVFITKDVAELIDSYAKHTSPREICGYLGSSHPESRVVDSLIVPRQKVNCAEVRVSSGIGEAAERFDELSLFPRGFWHSHNTMAVFHSNTDHENNHRLIRAMASPNRVEPESKNIVCDGVLEVQHNCVVLSGEDMVIRIPREDLEPLVVTPPKGAEAAKVRVAIEIPRSTIVSLVNNAREDPLEAIAISMTRCPLCGAESEPEEEPADVVILQNAMLPDCMIKRDVAEKLNA